MNEKPPEERRYSDEEFALILRKASEIQASPGRAQGQAGKGGLTLQEIQSIAAEAGMDPQAVARAAALLGIMEGEEKSGLARALFGSPGRIHLQIEVPGHLPREEMGRILEIIRREAEQQGEVSQVLEGLEWKTVGELSAINVNLTPRGNGTSVQIVGDRSAAGALSFVFPVGGAAVLMGALGAVFEPTSAAGIVSLVGGMLGSGFLLGRTIWVTGTRSFRKKLARLMDTLSREVEGASVPTLPPGGSEEPSTE